MKCCKKLSTVASVICLTTASSLEWADGAPISIPSGPIGERTPRIYAGANLPALYSIEKSTFIPINLGGRFFLIEPDGPLASGCMANLERPMTFGYVTGGMATGREHTGGAKRPPVLDGGQAALWGSEAAKSEALTSLKTQMNGFQTRVGGEDFELVPLTFNVTSLSEVSMWTDGAHVAYSAHVTVSYVLLNPTCAGIISQVRDRLVELRSGLVAESRNEGGSSNDPTLESSLQKQWGKATRSVDGTAQSDDSAPIIVKTQSTLQVSNHALQSALTKVPTK